MIVCTKKNNKIKYNKNGKKPSTQFSFFTTMNPPIRVISNPVKPSSFLAVAYKPWDHDTPS